MVATRITPNSSLPKHPVASTIDAHYNAPIRKICCVGAGYVGGPTSAVMALKNPDIEFTVVDYDVSRIAAWQTHDLPIHEPKLLDIVRKARDGVKNERSPNLFFSTDVDRGIAEADLILLSVNTPTKNLGSGAGHASELSYLESAVRKIGEVSTSNKIIVEKSTVPCRTADTIRTILAMTAKPGLQFEILSNPEFLAEGTAMQNLLHPDRILIGSLKTAAGLQAASSLASVYGKWVDPERVITINLYSSELAKLAANALLAQRISSINALSAMCEGLGADVEEVSYAVGLDKRIGPRMLKASVGFGGSCLRKDVLSLAYIAESLNLTDVANYWRQVVSINEYQKDRFTQRIVRSLYTSLSNKTLAIFGFAYKKDTGDTRESPAISVAHNLLSEGAKLQIYDPLVQKSQIDYELRSSATDPDHVLRNVRVASSAQEACTGADAVVILTDWDEFRTMDWSRISGVMRRPMFVFDGQNLVNSAQLAQLGFRVESIGK